MARLPTPGGDTGSWGDILNAFLEVSLASDGTLNSGVVGNAQLQNGAVSNAKLDSITQTKLAQGASAYQKPVGGIPESDLDSATQTKVDAGGTSVQTVNSHTGPTVTVTKSDVSLGNVDNTSDVNKPVSTATQTALNAKLTASSNLSDLANASTARTNLGLDTAATHSAIDFLQTINNLSDLNSTSTARTNLGLGSSATHAASDFLQTTNNLSDVTASTARTNLGLGTSATHATTDFLQVSNNLSDLGSTTTARTNLGLPTSPSDGQLMAWNASLGQWVAQNPTGSSELAYAENNTGTKDGPFTGTFAWHDVTGCSIVVPASTRPVYLWAALMSGTTSGATASTPLFGFLQIIEVSNGVDTPITWQSGASINVANSAFPVFFPMRKLGTTARTRTFKLQFSNAATGSWSAFNGNSGTDSSRIGAVAM